MSLSSATVMSVMCSSVSVAVSPSPILRSGSCKMWAGNGRKGVTAFLYSPNIVCFTSITKPQDGPRCGGDVGFLLTAFSKGEWKKVTAIWEWMGEPLQTVYKSRVKLDLTECWWRKRMYIQHCLKEQEVLSEHLNQTEVLLLLLFFFVQTRAFLWYIFLSDFFFFLCWDFFSLSPMPLHQCSQLKSSFISCLFVTNVWDAGMRTWLAIVLMTNEREANTACLSAATVVQQGWQ